MFVAIWREVDCVPKTIRALLLTMSAATMDRRLKSVRNAAPFDLERTIDAKRKDILRRATPYKFSP